MWLEAVVTLEECRAFIRSVTPFEIEIDGPTRTLTLDPPDTIELIENVGLRLRMAGDIRWTIAHVHLPISFHVASMLLVPSIETQGGRDALVFRFLIEHVDFKAIPEFIDDKITDTINSALKKSALAWRFTETLDFHFSLPDRVESASRIDLGAKWGRLKITKEALVLATSLDVHAIPRASAAE